MTEKMAPVVNCAPARDQSFVPFYAVYFCLLLLPDVVSAWLLFWCIPSLKEVFKDFNTTLPLLTQYILSFADFLASPFVWPVGVLAVIGGPWLLAKFTIRFRMPMQRLTAAIMIMLLVMFLTLSEWMLVQMAMSMPLVRLFQSVTVGPM